MSDDLGYGDLGVTGHPYFKTPNLDTLAEQGVRFEQFYVNSPVCSPSRAAFMTGHHPSRYGLHRSILQPEVNRTFDVPDWLDPNAPMVTRLFQNAGYVTGHFGKWHLGGKWVEDAPGPSAYGIDAHRTYSSSGPGWPDVPHEQFQAHSSELFVSEAIRFIEANKDQPFYLNLWTRDPHGRHRPTASQLAVYQDVRVEPTGFSPHMREYLSRNPDPDAAMRIYGAAVTNLDAAVGRLLDALDELGLAEDTLVFFTSDNGREDSATYTTAVGSTGVLRGRKRSLYEGGIRVPGIARWPGRIPAGRVDAESVVTGADWLPTVCGLAGIELPERGFDGKDVRDVLFGLSRPRTRPIYWETNSIALGDERDRSPGLAIREGDWKLLLHPDGTGAELYDLATDPEERVDLAAAHPDVAGGLSAKLLAWAKTLPD